MAGIYSCLDNKTFEIIDSKNLIIVDSKLAKTISILNKKGYYIDMHSIAKIGNIFRISDVIHNLISEKILDIYNHNEQIKNAIKYASSESTIIIFKENYKFDELPIGYEKYNNKMFYYLSILKNTEIVSFKSLVELEHELTESINNLQDWAEKLPCIV